MIKRLFRPPPPVGDAILRAIHSLKIQRFKLEQIVVRLKQRDSVLFDSCVAAIGGQHKERAAVFANELVEVRKLIDTVSKTEITIERIILRLETIKELNNVVHELRPALRALQSVAKCISRVMPEMACELETVNDSLTDTLAITKMGTPQPVIPLDVKTAEAEEILKEVSGVLEDKMMEKLPEPPLSAPIGQETTAAKSVKKMVALAACCASSARGSEEPQTYLELKRVSVTVQKSSPVEDRILEYIKRQGTQFDAARCARELNVPSQEIEETMDKLRAEGKILLKR